VGHSRKEQRQEAVSSDSVFPQLGHEEYKLRSMLLTQERLVLILRKAVTHTRRRPTGASNLGPLFFLILAMLIGPAVVAQKASTTFDEGYNFSIHQRYAWRENRLATQQHPDTNEVMDLKIVKVVNRTLAARGFVEVKDRPDFYIQYDGGAESDIGAGGHARANSGPLTPSDPGPTYGLGMGPSLAPATWLKVYGEIVFHITDVGSGKPVWETTYSKTFHDPRKALRNMDKEVNQLVEKSFKDFPPRPKK
jgi:hypothetical protein